MPTWAARVTRGATNTARVAAMLYAAAALAAPAGGAASPGAGESAAGGATVLVVGDSISAGYGIQREQGWVDALAKRLVGSGWRVVNASVSGETTGGGLARLPDALERHGPAVVILELGGNDGLRGYPVERIHDNLADMVRLSREAGSRVLLVGMQIPPNYGPRYSQAFGALFGRIADEQQVALVPFLLEAVALEPALMQSDGIHPTAAAQRLLLDTVWPHLEPLLNHAVAGSGHTSAEAR